MVGEPLNFYGQISEPENGKTQLVFDGTHAEDGVGESSSRSLQLTSARFTTGNFMKEAS